jgi:hypothetical protein
MEDAFHCKSDSVVVSVDRFWVLRPRGRASSRKKYPVGRKSISSRPPPTTTAPITSIPIRSAGSGFPGEAHIEDAIRDLSRAFRNHLLEKQALTTTGTTTYGR